MGCGLAQVTGLLQSNSTLDPMKFETELTPHATAAMIEEGKMKSAAKRGGVERRAVWATIKPQLDCGHGSFALNKGNSQPSDCAIYSKWCGYLYLRRLDCDSVRCWSCNFESILGRYL